MEELYRAKYVGRPSELSCPLSAGWTTQHPNILINPETLQNLLFRVFVEASLVFGDYVNLQSLQWK